MIRAALFASALALAACTAAKPMPEAAAATSAKPMDEGHAGMQPMLDSADGASKSFDHKPAAGEKAICPVSSEAFSVTADTKVQQVDGRWYAFCCDDCAPDFAKDPAKYTKQ